LSILPIETARAFRPLLKPSRYKGAFGGRGSGKSHFFAGLLVEDHIRHPGENQGEGLRSVCLREVQKDLTQSAKLLIEDKLTANSLGEADGFRVYHDRIVTPGDGLIIFKGMQDYSADSIKSLEKFKRAWWEEAQTAQPTSLAMLRPTIREDGSEIWFSWNPRRKNDPVDMLLRGPSPPTGAIVVKVNWERNPWLPATLVQERLDCLRDNPDQYDHIWEGGYATSHAGSYFGKLLATAKLEGRIGRGVVADPLLPLRAFIDIGGSGALADAFCIWIVQWIGQEIRVLDYYESVGQVLATHVNWLRNKGYEKASIYLPHDGVNANNITGKRYEDHLREAGLTVEKPIANQGRGAAMMRVEAIRRLAPRIWFHDTKTEAGRDALGYYHERMDETRNIGLGPEHDWSSHAADAFGLMAICYEEPSRAKGFNRKLEYQRLGVA
jgi:phage terminase large subunit